MDSGASASIINESYVCKNNFITRKTSANKWSTGSFLRHTRPKLRLKCQINVTAHISAPFHVKTKKCVYEVIVGRNLLWELGIQLDFQNNFIGWKDINFPMKPIDCKLRAHFTIQDSKNIRNATKRIKKISDTNY